MLNELSIPERFSPYVYDWPSRTVPETKRSEEPSDQGQVDLDPSYVLLADVTGAEIRLDPGYVVLADVTGAEIRLDPGCVVLADVTGAETRLDPDCVVLDDVTATEIRLDDCVAGLAPARRLRRGA